MDPSNDEAKANEPTNGELPRTTAEIDVEIARLVAELAAARRLRTITARYERDKAALTATAAAK